jgi:uncharacterized membrane protein YcaP (DUF421 family)
MFLFIDLLGLNVNDLEWYQMLVRTLIVFIAALAFIRLSGMRTFGMQSPFDMVVYITLGGMLSKTIMGHYPFFPCLAACAGLVTLHRLVSILSFRSKIIHKLTEGDAVLLFSEGREKSKVLEKYDISRKDLMVTIRENGLDSFETIKSIWLEPDGTISVVKKD